VLYLSNTSVRFRIALPLVVSVEFIQHNKKYKERMFNSRTVILARSFGMKYLNVTKFHFAWYPLLAVEVCSKISWPYKRWQGSSWIWEFIVFGLICDYLQRSTEYSDKISGVSVILDFFYSSRNGVLHITRIWRVAEFRRWSSCFGVNTGDEASRFNIAHTPKKSEVRTYHLVWLRAR